MPFNKTNHNVLILLLCLLFNTAFGQTAEKLHFQNTDLYAGIEVGSKGVKMSFVEISSLALKNGSFKIIKDTSVNTDFISFTDASFQATLKGLTGLYNFAQNVNQIPKDQIFTVFSSGVKVVAEREKKTNVLSIFADSFRLAINEKQRKMEPIDVMDEARLSHLGIVPNAKRYTTFLIDIGSGNTKGGYFPNGNTNDFKLFQLTWGTKSILNSTEKRLDDDNSLFNFNKQLQRVLSGPAEEEIIYAVNVSGAYNMSDNIAFSGGIAWASATLMFPELAENPVIPLTYNDLAAFNEKLYTNFSSLSDTSIIRRIKDKSLNKEYISKEIKQVNKVFDQKALLSGTGLLLKIMRQFEGVYEKKQFYFVKNGQVGWISAYVNQSIAK
jgi:hypothetical protein